MCVGSQSWTQLSGFHSLADLLGLPFSPRFSLFYMSVMTLKHFGSILFSPLSFPQEVKESGMWN